MRKSIKKMLIIYHPHYADEWPGLGIESLKVASSIYRDA